MASCGSQGETLSSGAGTSKSAKRREKDKAKQGTLAEQLGARHAPVRVLHAAGIASRSAADLAASDFPTLSGSASSPDLQVRQCRVRLASPAR